jgi:hypothetical protein
MTGDWVGLLRAVLLAAAVPQAADEAAAERVHELRKQKRFREALAYLDQAVQESPRSGNLRGLYSWIHLHDLKDPKAALDYALRLKKDLPRHVGGYYWSAKAYEATGEYAKCVETLDDYLPYGTEFSRHNLKAACHYENGDPESALWSLPRERELQDGFTRFEGWGIWLRGQIARRRLFLEQKQQLRAQLGAPSARERTIALIKIGILGVPEAAALLDVAGANAESSAVATRLKKELLAAPLFHEERKKPHTTEGARRFDLPAALALIWKELDEPPAIDRLPPLGGRYMTAQMKEMAKAYPSAAQPLKIEINEAGDQISFGAGWIKVGAEIDTSYEPGRWFSIYRVSQGVFSTLTVGLQDKATSISSSSYRLEGQELVLESRGWIDLGDEFSFYEHRPPTKYTRVP